MGYRDQGFLNVLVIDDDAALRELIGRFVLSEGHQVVTAGSAEEALAELPFHTFDAALLDHHLPGMEGLVLGEYLHRNNPQMEVVLMTGDPDARTAREALGYGLTLFTKPFELERVHELLDRAIRRAKARRATTEMHALRFDEGGAEAETRSVRPAGIDLAAHFEALHEAFGLSAVPRRVEEQLARHIREALETLELRDPSDARARAIAYAGIVAAQVLGLKLPRTKAGATYAAWYDALMVESGEASAFTFAPPEAP